MRTAGGATGGGPAAELERRPIARLEADVDGRGDGCRDHQTTPGGAGGAAIDAPIQEPADRRDDQRVGARAAGRRGNRWQRS